MNQNPQFLAPWSTLVKSVTAVTTLLLLGLPVMAYWLNPQMPDWAAVLCIGSPLLILIVAALYMVHGYSIADRTLVIHRLYFQTRVDLGEAPRATAQPDAMGGAMRLWGNGGLFAICGWFRNLELGTFRAWVTDPERTVVLRVGDKVCVVSPADPEAFVAAIRKLGSDASVTD